MREPTGCTATCRRSGRRERGTGPCLGAVILWSVVMVWAGWPGNAAAAARIWADFNGDGFADLAIGIPLENGIGGSRDAGAVQVLYGSPSGLQAVGNQVWHQGSSGILDVAEPDDTFGQALTAGDLNGDGVDDLAIGVPREAIGGVVSAGAVQVLYGSASGLQATGSQTWHQDTSGIQGVAEPYDHFGEALTAGDLNGDGVDDLAVGVPGEAFGSSRDTERGAVQVLYGSASGLQATGNQYWHQDTSGIPDFMEPGDRFGAALTAGDFNGDGVDDLAIGVPGEDIGDPIIEDAGVVQIIFGSASGLTADGDQFWYQNTPVILDSAMQYDRFGLSLSH